MRSRSAFILGIQQLLGREHAADPRVAQFLFLVPVALDACGVVLVQDVTPRASYVVGLALVAVATVVAVRVGQGRLSERSSVLIPTADLLALGLMRVELVSTVGIVMVFPAIWLGLQYG